MSISEFTVNIDNKCGNCKDFYREDETCFWGQCISSISKARNKTCRSEKSKACSWQRRIK